MIANRRPVLFFAFANEREDGAWYLRNLPTEQRNLRNAMQPAVLAGHCEIVERNNATVDDVFDVLQDERYRDRIAIFHFGGHAAGSVLELETSEGKLVEAHAGGLADFLGQQHSLVLVFLNGCSTRGHVKKLLGNGVPVVVATSQAIEDKVATGFATRFYQALTAGAPLRTAFREAESAVRAEFGEDPRNMTVLAVPERAPEVPWPWELHVAPGAEETLGKWSLPAAAGDPLFGLPTPPEEDLPSSPFKHLHWFERKDAEIFFGRGEEIRELYEAVTLPGRAPIVLLYGATGVGKSSLLAAGLVPRLNQGHEVAYLRRENNRGLAATLAGALSGDEALQEPATAWRLREAAADRPLMVILDQVEEAWTQALAGDKVELDSFSVVLRRLFAVRNRRPRGRLVLGFRKEWLAEVLRILHRENLPVAQVEISHLGREGIAEAVTGVTKIQRLRQHYRLEVEPAVVNEIVADLAEGWQDHRGQHPAQVAPVLQLLLTKMWHEASKASPAAPLFTLDLYRRFKRRGLHLDDFLEEKLDELRIWRPEVEQSGLALDLLAHHTTPLGTAETRSAVAVLDRYGGRPEVSELLQQCKDRYLLIGTARAQDGALVAVSQDPKDKGSTRLAHDTLAPLVRRRFEASDRPGQRARRILLERSRDWRHGRDGPTLGEADLKIVEEGSEGMRDWREAESRLVKASRRTSQRRLRRRRALQGLGTAALIAIMGTTWLAWIKNQQVQRSLVRTHMQEGIRLLGQGEKSPALAYFAAALKLDPSDLVLRAHILDLIVTLGSPKPPGPLPFANDRLQRRRDVLWLRNQAYSAAFSLDDKRIVAAFEDGSVRVWNSATGEPLGRPLRHGDSVRSVAFSPDGGRVLTASGSTAQMWELATGSKTELCFKHDKEILSIAFSPNGRLVPEPARRSLGQAT